MTMTLKMRIIAVLKHIRIYYPLYLMIMLLISGTLIFKYLWLFDPVLSKAYDSLYDNQPIENEVQLDSILKQFPSVPFRKLPEKLLSSIESRQSKCGSWNIDSVYQNGRFYKISWTQRYQYLVGSHRVLEFLAPGRMFFNTIKIPQLTKHQHLFIDKDILLRILALDSTLRSRKLTTDYSITSGFRHPRYNKLVNGKKCSRHLFGDAIDIAVQDINGDGRITRKDKRIITKILDKKIIRKNGGLGSYEHHPMVLHIDTRGYKARWNY